jgi:acetyl-CoA carboxylase carboxyl transferase beta subunit
MDRADAVTSRRQAPRRRLQAPGPELRPTAPTAGTIACPQCQRRFVADRYAADLNVCSECGHHGVVGAAQRIEQLADPGTPETLARNVGDRDPLGFDDGVPYPQRVARAREKTGLHEAFQIARASVESNPVVLACMDFGFLGGSLGSGAGEIFARGCEIAVAEDRALVAVCTSGGARMQEGIASLAQMARCSSAVVEVMTARLPYISILGDPCFGGVTASFAVQADAIIAEPGARIGFAGGRVIEQATHDKLPDGFQTAEFLLAHGMVDMVVERGHLRATVGTLIRIYTGRA